MGTTIKFILVLALLIEGVVYSALAANLGLQASWDLYDLISRCSMLVVACVALYAACGHKLDGEHRLLIAAMVFLRGIDLVDFLLSYASAPFDLGILKILIWLVAGSTIALLFFRMVRREYLALISGYNNNGIYECERAPETFFESLKYLFLFITNATKVLVVEGYEIGPATKKHIPKKGNIYRRIERSAGHASKSRREAA